MAMAHQRHPVQRWGSPRAPLLLRCLVLGLGALVAATAISGLVALGAPSFAASGQARTLGGERVPQRLATSRLARQAAEQGAAVGPVVDDSDFGDEAAPAPAPPPSPPPAGQGGQIKNRTLDSIMSAADSFAIKKDRAKKKPARTNSASLSTIEEDFQGMSLENEVDMSMSMAATARSGKVDLSLETRLNKWVEESQELISNPTKVQLTYSIIFVSTIALVFLLGIFTISAGGVRTRGDDLAVDRRRQAVMQDAYIQRWNILIENKKKFAAVEDIRDANVVDESDKIYYGPPIIKLPGDNPDDPSKLPRFLLPGQYPDAPPPDAESEASPEAAAPAPADPPARLPATLAPMPGT